jgi:hypothetical protein
MIGRCVCADTNKQAGEPFYIQAIDIGFPPSIRISRCRSIITVGSVDGYQVPLVG